MQDLNWDNLRFFLAASRHLSFSRAARSLGVNESTVARRVAQMEKQLGARLFDRHLKKIQLTAPGFDLLPFAERMETESLKAETCLARSEKAVSGTVRVTAVPLLVNYVLIPALPLLLSNHPALKVELVADAENLTIAGREADLALRLARPQGDLRAITRKIGTLDYALYGRKDIAGEALNWIAYDSSMKGLPHADWLNEQISRNPEATTLLSVNDADSMLHALKAGLGQSVLPVRVGDAEKTLSRRRATDCPPRELWMMVHPERRNLLRIKAVTDWVMTLFDPRP